MKFPNKYRCLSNNTFTEGEYSIVPIRYEDRFQIMKWRNEQIYHLRQDKPLTEEDQENYFNNVVSKLFHQEKPNQILFSFLKNEKCIGYGGLVHIDWEHKHGEISFLLETSVNKDISFYEESFSIFLKLIKKVAQDTKLNKIYTYGYDIFEYRFLPLEKCSFQLDAILRNHVKIDGLFYNVRIYSQLI